MCFKMCLDRKCGVSQGRAGTSVSVTIRVPALELFVNNAISSADRVTTLLLDVCVCVCVCVCVFSSIILYRSLSQPTAPNSNCMKMVLFVVSPPTLGEGGSKRPAETMKLWLTLYANIYCINKKGDSCHLGQSHQWNSVELFVISQQFASCFSNDLGMVQLGDGI